MHVHKKIKLRDLKDEKRSIAPLKKAADAILIDSTNLSI
ncbi:MAG: (d)CMP kinase, partial [Sweet potato little leaf phytoplasma]|nr:(d)CMP kinase [Sweet potato little leaf phytoplasma]